MSPMFKAAEYNALLEAARATDDIFDSASEEPDQVSIRVSDSQYDAITYPARADEVVRIVAAPGSGKTFTLTARIAHMVQNGTDPAEILVLCMANRSVEAVKKALTAIIGKDEAQRVSISTFHSFSAMVLEQDGGVAAGARRRVFDNRCWRNFVRTFLARLAQLGLHRVEGKVSAGQLERILAGVARGEFSVAEAAERHKISAAYVEALLLYLEAQGVLRYDDLLLECARLLEGKMPFPRLLTCTKVFVDEFQDIHPLLMRIIAAVVKYPTEGQDDVFKHLTVAGDPRQCIYDFLGAQRDNMEKLVQHVPRPVADKPLCELFRCTQQILDVAALIDFGNAAEDKASAIVPSAQESSQKETEVQSMEASEKFPANKIVHVKVEADVQTVAATPNTAATNSGRSPGLSHLDKPALALLSNRESGPRPVLLPARNELDHVCKEIVRLLCCLALLQPRDMAILARTNAEATRATAALTALGIPAVKVAPGNAWVDSNMHVYRDVLSVICGGSDAGLSLLNVMALLDPHRGARARAARTLTKSFEQPYGDQPDALEIFLHAELVDMEKGNTSGLLARIYRTCPDLLENIAAFLNQVQIERETVRALHSQDPLAYTPLQLVQCLARMARLAGIHDYVFAAESGSTRPKVGGGSTTSGADLLTSFNNSVHHSFDMYSGSAEAQTMPFIDYFLQTYDNEVPPPNTNLVRVSTIHSAKGLEFPVVFVLALGARTSWEKILAPESFLADYASRHLLFVALTRARTLLYVGSALGHDELPSLVRRWFLHEKPQFLTLSTDLPHAESPAQNTELTAALANLSINERDQLQRKQEVKGQQWAEKSGTDRHTMLEYARPTLLLKNLASDLKRELPLVEKLTRGHELYARLFPKENQPHAISIKPLLSGSSALRSPLLATLRSTKNFFRRA